MNDFEQLPFVHPVTQSIYQVDGQNKGRFPYCNSFLLLGDRAVLIDSGIGVERLEEIDRRVRIDTLLISHPHPDHIRAWHVLENRQLILPAQTPASVEDLRLLGRRFVEGREDAQYWTEVVRHRFGIHPLRSPNRRFDDGEILDFGSIRLEAIHAPGHLDDHYCFLEHSTKTLFTIDVDFTSFGPWYGNPEGDILRFRESVIKLRELPCHRICTSHRRFIRRSEADEPFRQFLDAFDRQKAAVFALCREGIGLEMMTQASPFYHNRMPDATLQRIFETQMIRKNLELLISEGQIVEKNGRYCAI
jgi:glyoxylase-like metal-dependent hydrolase (beta-lactamase superfamily II)